MPAYVSSSANLSVIKIGKSLIWDSGSANSCVAHRQAFNQEHFSAIFKGNRHLPSPLRRAALHEDFLSIEQGSPFSINTL
jgi:hypothetical protein